LIQSSQCGHHEPPCFAARSSHASAPAMLAAPVQKQALGLPGGLSRLWIWPLLASTGRDVIGQAADDVAVKVEPAHVERHAAHL